MGFEVRRFQRKLPTELLCPICAGVFDAPVHCLDCGDFFCKSCALSHSNALCLHPEESLTEANRFLQHKLSNLVLCCSFKAFGCRHATKVANIEAHEANCHFKAHTCLNANCPTEGPVPLIASHTPKCEHRRVRCPQGCGALLSSKQPHDCIRQLKEQTIAKAKRNADLEQQVLEAKRTLQAQTAEVAEYENSVAEETETLIKALTEEHFAREIELNKHSQSILECKETHEGEFSEFQDAIKENLDSYFQRTRQDLQDLEVAVLSSTKAHWERELDQMQGYLIKSKANAGSFCRKESPIRFSVSSTPKGNKSFSN